MPCSVRRKKGERERENKVGEGKGSLAEVETAETKKKKKRGAYCHDNQGGESTRKHSRFRVSHCHKSCYYKSLVTNLARTVIVKQWKHITKSN